jgi:hypothetical protein
MGLGSKRDFQGRRLARVDWLESHRTIQFLVNLFFNKWKRSNSNSFKQLGTTVAGL